MTGATQSGSQLQKSVEAGEGIGLNVVPESGKTISNAQWQISKTTTEPTNDEDWEALGTGTTLNTKATTAMNNKWVRCLATVDGKAVVAKTADNLSNVKLLVTDTQHLTLTLVDSTTTPYAEATEANDKYTIFDGKTGTVTNPVLKLAVKATGGGSEKPTYVWKKDGKTEFPDGVAPSETKVSLIFTSVLLFN